MGTGKTVIPVRQANVAAPPSCSTGCPSASAGCSSGASACSSGPEADLQKQGWVMRTTIGEPRLSEVVENYRAMGYEVHVERWSTGDASCTTCYDSADKSAAADVWGTVYVRPGKPAENKDELF